MFRITEDPSSGSLVQCLAKNYKNDSIVPLDMEKVGVMAAYYARVCSALSAFIYSALHKHSGSEYAAITQTLSMSTGTIESFL